MDRRDQHNRRSPSPGSRSPHSRESERAPEDMASDCSGHSPQSSLAAAGTSAGKAAKKKKTKKLSGSGRRRMRRELTQNDTETGGGPVVQLQPAPVVVHEFKPSEPPAAVRAASDQRRVTFEAAHHSKASPKSKGKGRKRSKNSRPRPGPRKGKGKGGGKKKQPGGTRRVLPPNLR